MSLMFVGCRLLRMNGNSSSRYIACPTRRQWSQLHAPCAVAVWISIEDGAHTTRMARACPTSMTHAWHTHGTRMPPPPRVHVPSSFSRRAAPRPAARPPPPRPSTFGDPATSRSPVSWTKSFHTKIQRFEYRWLMRMLRKVSQTARNVRGWRAFTFSCGVFVDARDAQTLGGDTPPASPPRPWGSGPPPSPACAAAASTAQSPP